MTSTDTRSYDAGKTEPASADSRPGEAATDRQDTTKGLRCHARAVVAVTDTQLSAHIGGLLANEEFNVLTAESENEMLRLLVLPDCRIMITDTEHLGPSIGVLITQLRGQGCCPQLVRITWSDGQPAGDGADLVRCDDELNVPRSFTEYVSFSEMIIAMARACSYRGTLGQDRGRA